MQHNGNNSWNGWSGSAELPPPPPLVDPAGPAVFPPPPPPSTTLIPSQPVWDHLMPDTPPLPWQAVPVAVQTHGAWETFHVTKQ